MQMLTRMGRGLRAARAGGGSRVLPGGGGRGRRAAGRLPRGRAGRRSGELSSSAPVIASSTLPTYVLFLAILWAQHPLTDVLAAAFAMSLAPGAHGQF